MHIGNNKKPGSISTVSKEQYSGNEDYIERSTKIILKTNYKKSNYTIIDKSAAAGDLNILSKKELADKYGVQNYTVESINKNQIVLIRELDQFAPNKNEPNKYVLGIYNGYVAIFRTDSKGNMYIEDKSKDITKIRESNLKKGDIKLFTDGELHFNTIDEAQSELEDYI